MALRERLHRPDRPEASRNDNLDVDPTSERYRKRVEPAAVASPDRARAGFSMWSILSGVLVAFGAFVVLGSILGAIFAATGVAEGGISAREATNTGLGAAAGLILAQFLSYMWGGYTAGRMARGSGPLNGLLVALTALILMALVGGLVAALTGTTSPDEASSYLSTLPLPLDQLGVISAGVGIGVVLAMLLGGTLGGWLGERWHTKLENASAYTGQI